MRMLIILIASIACVCGNNYDFPKCKKSDPNIQKCTLDAFKTMWPKLMQGIPELKLPPLDPFHVSKLKIKKSVPNINVDVVFTNMTGLGASSSQIKDLLLKAGADTWEGKMKVYIPKVSITSNFEINEIEVFGSKESGTTGNFEMVLADIKATVETVAKETTKDGKNYLHFEDLTCDINIGDAHVKVETSKGNKLADYYTLCKIKDPKVNECLRKGIEDLRPHLVDGIPQMKIPSIDPCHIPRIKIDKSLQGIQVNAVLENIVGYGGKDFQVKDLKSRFTDNSYGGEVVLYLPNINATCDYKILNLEVLAYKDKGSSGKFQGHFTDITVKVNGHAKPIIKDGVKYLELEELTADIKIGNGHVKITDSKGNGIGELSTVAFNTDPPTMLKALKEVIDDATEVVVMSKLKKILNAMTMNELFD